MQRRHWINGVLGLWIILLAFLGFPSSVRKILLILTGLFVAIVSFSKASNYYIEEASDDENI